MGMRSILLMHLDVNIYFYEEPSDQIMTSSADEEKVNEKD